MSAKRFRGLGPPTERPANDYDGGVKDGNRTPLEMVGSSEFQGLDDVGSDAKALTSQHNQL